MSGSAGKALTPRVNPRPKDSIFSLDRWRRPALCCAASALLAAIAPVALAQEPPPPPDQTKPPADAAEVPVSVVFDASEPDSIVIEMSDVTGVTKKFELQSEVLGKDLEDLLDLPPASVVPGRKR